MKDIIKCNWIKVLVWLVGKRSISTFTHTLKMSTPILSLLAATLMIVGQVVCFLTYIRRGEDPVLISQHHIMMFKTWCLNTDAKDTPWCNY